MADGPEPSPQQLIVKQGVPVKQPPQADIYHWLTQKLVYLGITELIISAFPNYMSSKCVSLATGNSGKCSPPDSRRMLKWYGPFIRITCFWNLLNVAGAYYIYIYDICLAFSLGLCISVQSWNWNVMERTISKNHSMLISILGCQFRKNGPATRSQDFSAAIAMASLLRLCIFRIWS